MIREKLDLRDFFDAYDRGDPHMKAAVSELHCQILREAPHLLDPKITWFEYWKGTRGGKRNLKTGFPESDANLRDLNQKLC